MDTTARQQAKTFNVASTSVSDVRRALAAVGACILHQETTRGACGYTTLTVQG